MSLVVGLFVGGRGTRLGGVVKGNLPGPSGERLVDRLLEVCARAVPGSPVVLVGDATAHRDLGLPMLADEPPGIGPIGGLSALLGHASTTGADAALALACDLPFLEAPLVRRLATEAPDAWFVAPCEGELFHVLTARYSKSALPAVRETIAAGERSLQRVVRRLGAHASPLPVGAEELAELRDWDDPADISFR